MPVDMDVEDAMDYCEVCTTAGQNLQQPLEPQRRRESIKNIDLEFIIANFGTVGRIVTNDGCVSCKDLQREMHNWEREHNWARSDDLFLVVSLSPSFIQFPLYLETRELDQSNNLRLPKRPQQHSVGLYSTESSDEDIILGRLFDTESIDLQLIRGWVRCCEDTHGDTCTSKLSPQMEYSSPLKRILFIDAEKKCLVYGSLDDRYMALSYVWGQVATVRTTESSLARMTEPGVIGYDTHDSDCSLPATIRDFIRLANLLGVRYAWVDALCIVEDAPDKVDQLHAMASIYDGALLTVISEGTDADFGLLGIGSGARPRNRACNQLRIPGVTMVIEDDVYDPFIPTTNPRTWETRGWTLQEALFSRRALTFHHDGIVSWRCRKCSWSETKNQPSEREDWAEKNPSSRIEDWRYLGLNGINVEWPDMRRWCELAEEYFSRRLTYDYDALNALAGTISVINKISTGGFIWGLPAYYFDIFLLWDIECFEGIDVPQRRNESAAIPTWSFLGWKGGNLDTMWWRFSMDHFGHVNPLLFGTHVIVTPTVSDWRLECHGTKESILIGNDFHAARSQPLSDFDPGWSEDCQLGTKVYTHPSIRNVKFNCPVPLRKDTNSARLSAGGYSKHLRFETRIGSLRIGEVITRDKKNKSTCLDAALVGSDGETWAGVIRLLSSQLEERAESARMVDLIENGIMGLFPETKRATNFISSYGWNGKKESHIGKLSAG
ncbi:Heterokaryon incompatibility [Apiospora saccharicola]